MPNRPTWAIFTIVLPLVALLTAPGPLALASEPDAVEILRRAEEIRSPETDYAVDLTIKVVNPNSSWKERIARYTMIAHGKDYSFILMREPKYFYPGTLLIMRGLYWMLFPRSDKPIQLSQQHILNGDVSNGDLARGNLLKNYEPRLDGEERIEGRSCWRFELARVNSIAHYPRIRCWIQKKKLRPVKFEYFGKTGKLLKSAYYTEYRQGALGVRPMTIEVETHSRPDDKTTLTFSNLRPVDASRAEFTVPGLIAFRDAARRMSEVDGAQAQAEDLLAMLNPSGS